MKAIILAAGVGSRLRPMTNVKPKTLVEVNGKAMLGYIIDALVGNNINSIAICLGYKSSLIINYCRTEYPNISFDFIENKNYETTNNMYSLYLARHLLTEDIILMNADLVFDPKVINKLLESKGTSIAVDKGVYLEESMKITIDQNNVITGISKKINKQDCYGSSIDVYRIAKQDIHLVHNEMKKIIEKDNDKNQWTEVMLNNLFESKKLIAYPINIHGNNWYEIDNYDDLARAEMLFNTSLCELKLKKAFFLDRDGTLQMDGKLIPGADEFVSLLQKKGKLVYVLTNNSSKTPRGHAESFKTSDIPLKEENVLVSLDSALDYLGAKEIKEIFFVANTEVSTYIKTKGFRYNEVDPQAILLTYDTELTYQKMVTLCVLVRKGLPYFATHHDVVCPTLDGDVPDIGTFIEMVRLTTSITPNMVFGKPSIAMIEQVLKKYNLQLSDCVVIGDRLYTDIAMALDSELTSVLVLSGESSRDMYEFSNTRADIVVNSVSDLIISL